jgi:pimeloyl-ACP methyl ester carboxylesterase
MTADRKSEFVEVHDGKVQVFREGSGPAVVLLPSYGRDGGEDFDHFSALLASAGFLVLRPQPRGTGESTKATEGITAIEQADDIARVIQTCAGGQAFLLGHAFGHFIARIIATVHAKAVRGIILAASQAKRVSRLMATAPFLAANAALGDEERLAILQGAFFAPGHDARPWLEGWYPTTLAMQGASVRDIDTSKYWAAGEAPLLEVIPESDAFKPPHSWRELREEFPGRVTASLIADAGHALFPEQPEQVAEAVIRWCKKVSSRRS